MPTYQIYLYVWQKIFGSGEWAMRAANIPLFILGQLAFLSLLRQRPKLALTACLLAAVSPIVWMYLDETRPYIMQYAAACWLTAGLVMAGRSQCPNAAFNTLQGVVLCAAFFVLFSSSLLGAVWAVCFAAAFLPLRAWTKLPVRKVLFLAMAAFTAGMILAFAAYYLFTWSDARRGYHLSGASLLSVPFVAYEMLGFSGFGPAKYILRTESAPALISAFPRFVPLSIVLAGLATVWVRSLRQRTINRNVIISWLLALALPSAAILFAFYSQGHQPLSRHFIPLLPTVMIALAAAMQRAWQQPSIFWRATAGLLPILWAISALNLRLNPIHSKEDYRAAAQVASEALKNSQSVWWVADAAAAFVYHTPVALQKQYGHAWAMQAPAWESLKLRFPPDLIIVSRPDVFDPQGAMARYIQENNFAPTRTFTGITIFTRQNFSP